jgi:hypothetical protein
MEGRLLCLELSNWSDVHGHSLSLLPTKAPITNDGIALLGVNLNIRTETETRDPDATHKKHRTTQDDDHGVGAWILKPVLRKGFVLPSGQKGCINLAGLETASSNAANPKETA